MQSIAFKNNSEGWATSSNRIYKYDGSTWKVEYYLSSANLTEAIGTTTDIWFYGDKTYRWNGSQLTDQNLSSNSIIDMHFINNSTGFAIDDNANAYMFNGVGWISLGQVLSSAPYVFSISGSSKNDVWSSVMTLGSYVNLYHYNGTAWTYVAYYDLRQVRMVSSTEGWASSGFGNIYYYNGSSWNIVGTVSGNIKEVKDFGNGNLWGIIYGSSGNPNKLMRLQ
jgi:hypothetical protein